MAYVCDISTNQVGNSYCPQVNLKVNITSEDHEFVYYDWYLYYVTYGYAAYTNGYARNVTATVGGDTFTGSININGLTGTTLIDSGSSYLYKHKESRTVECSVSFNINLDDNGWNGVIVETTTASGSFDINPKTSYTVSYNANGGNGIMSSSTAMYGEEFITKQNAFTRTGYTFNGWNESADGTGTSWTLTSDGVYEFGESWTWTYTNNIILYAQWEANTYTITYDANHGTNAPSATTYTYADSGTINLSSTMPTRTGHTFLGWSTSDSATNATYSAGSSFDKNTASDTTLYAVWRENVLTVRYNSNYATYACVDGVENTEVSADKKDVVVRTSEYKYATAIEGGLCNYSSENDDTYMERARYDALGYWGTSSASEEGTAIHENTVFESGAKLAEALGVLTNFENGDVSIDLYALWVLLASTVTVYDSDGNAQKGLCYFYVNNMNFVTMGKMTFIDSNDDYFMVDDGDANFITSDGMTFIDSNDDYFIVSNDANFVTMGRMAFVDSNKGYFIVNNDINLVTSDGMTFVDSDNNYFIVSGGNCCYGIITVYDSEGIPHVAV